jgi:hypothetical protein
MIVQVDASVAPAILELILALSQVESPPERLTNTIIGLVVATIILLCFIALILTLTSLLPTASRASQTALNRAPWRAFFIGLANYLFLGGISLVLLSTEIPFLTTPGLLIATFLLSVTAIGLTGLARLAGERLGELSGQDRSPLQQLIWGALSLGLAGLLPFIGWFVLTPILLLASFGAAVLAWRNRKQVDSR